jgi:magnesium-transporting ATPase (P-type)
MVGTGLGAQRGVLFKNAIALETSAHIQVVVMDKTATLTEGEPAVTDLVTADDDVDRDELLVAAVERGWTAGGSWSATGGCWSAWASGSQATPRGLSRTTHRRSADGSKALSAGLPAALSSCGTRPVPGRPSSRTASASGRSVRHYSCVGCP